MNKETIIGALIGISGIALIVVYYDWKLALGIYLMIFGNNIQSNKKNDSNNKQAKSKENLPGEQG